MKSITYQRINLAVAVLVAGCASGGAMITAHALQGFPRGYVYDQDGIAMLLAPVVFLWALYMMILGIDVGYRRRLKAETEERARLIRGDLRSVN